MSELLAEHRDDEFDGLSLRCQGPIERFCTALVAVDGSHQLHRLLTVVPNDSAVLSVQFAHGMELPSQPADRGLLPQLCGWRQTRHSFLATGGFRCLHALLTPEGALALSAGKELPGGDQPVQPLATIMDRVHLVDLEDRLAAEGAAIQQLVRLGAWLERRLTQKMHLPWQALRAARVATSLIETPALNMALVAQTERMSRRQMERDFRRWFNVSPKQVSLVARGQAAARLGHRGSPPAEIAQLLSFVDQAHLNRVVKKIFGVSPPVLARSAQTALGMAFRHASRGGVVYL